VKGVIRILLVLIAVWLQVSFFGAFRIFDVLPNVMLVLIIYAGLICRVSDAVLMALVGGILLDLSSGVDFGLRMGFYILLGLLIAVLKQAGTDFENTAMVLAVTLAGTVLYDVAALSGLILHSAPIPWGIVMTRIGVEIAVNAVLALLLRWPLSRLLGNNDLSFSSGRRARSI
jgi:rod shape-determining protein MreD